MIRKLRTYQSLATVERELRSQGRKYAGHLGTDGEDLAESSYCVQQLDGNLVMGTRDIEANVIGPSEEKIRPISQPKTCLSRPKWRKNLSGDQDSERCG